MIIWGMHLVIVIAITRRIRAVTDNCIPQTTTKCYSPIYSLPAPLKGVLGKQFSLFLIYLEEVSFG